jgi:hypothetical protein
MLGSIIHHPYTQQAMEYFYSTQGRLDLDVQWQEMCVTGRIVYSSRCKPIGRELKNRFKTWRVKEKATSG